MSGVIDPSLVVHAWFQTLRPCCNNLNKSLSGYQNHENLVKACNCTFDDGDVVAHWQRTRLLGLMSPVQIRLLS